MSGIAGVLDGDYGGAGSLVSHLNSRLRRSVPMPASLCTGPLEPLTRALGDANAPLSELVPRQAPTDGVADRWSPLCSLVALYQWVSPLDKRVVVDHEVV